MRRVAKVISVALKTEVTRLQEDRPTAEEYERVCTSNHELEKENARLRANNHQLRAEKQRLVEMLYTARAKQMER